MRLDRGVADGQVHPDADRAAWSRYIAAVVQGMSVQARDGATRQALLSTAEIVTQALLTLRP